MEPIRQYSESVVIDLVLLAWLVGLAMGAMMGAFLRERKRPAIAEEVKPPAPVENVWAESSERGAAASPMPELSGLALRTTSST